MSGKRRRDTPEWAWEQALIDAYDDYRWHQVLDPLAAAVNRWSLPLPRMLVIGPHPGDLSKVGWSRSCRGASRPHRQKLTGPLSSKCTARHGCPLS